MFDDEMLTIEELAAYLKLKPQTLYKWAQQGKVPGAKFGKEWRFRRSAIERWIDSHMRAPSDGGASDLDEPGVSGSRRRRVPPRSGGDGSGPETN